MSETRILLDIIELAIIIVGTLVTRYLIPWIKSKTQNTKFQGICDWVSQYVAAAEYILVGEKTGAEKLEMVSILAERKAQQMNLDITSEDIRAIIERAVSQINQ